MNYKKNFFLSSLIKLLFFTFSFFFGCSTSWIRALPPNSILETNPEKIPRGMYLRNRPERSHINTLFYKNIVQEKILLNAENLTFEKSTKREIKDKNEYTIHIVSGKGKYVVSGNWVLLETYEKGEVFFQGNRETFQIEYFPFYHKLLYHHDPSTKTLVPLLYESGYQEKKYGLLDGIREPYLEDRYFQISRKNFLKKEFQFHAYFYQP